VWRRSYRKLDDRLCDQLSWLPTCLTMGRRRDAAARGRVELQQTLRHAPTPAGYVQFSRVGLQKPLRCEGIIMNGSGNS
jgi:hypothetical protein